nr:FAD-binding protein [Orrella marina]
MGALRSGRCGQHGTSLPDRPEIDLTLLCDQSDWRLVSHPGGLAVDPEAKVLSANGQPIPGLYAGGGAARGVSGSGDSGYLSGNGLLAAVMLGATAGESAARQTLDK